MQFTAGLLALALAITGTAAAPGVSPNPAIERRQFNGLILIQFFTEPNCQGTMIDSQTFIDLTNTQCTASQTRVANYPSWRLRQNDLIRDINLYSNDDCTGDVTTIATSVPIFTCFTQKVGSANF